VVIGTTDCQYSYELGDCTPKYYIFSSEAPADAFITRRNEEYEQKLGTDRYALWHMESRFEKIVVVDSVESF
jgi:hypothetical protein